ncbi:hypothetical protein HJC23_008170 [Cyclotella cryptica]|uniref:Uncharacterized protein n=1 Tax=Cyclotella cryptica TaxID=29204 RepID=A0ABD3PLR2_9STRA
MMSSNKDYWKKRDEELAAVVTGPRARKPSKKCQSDTTPPQNPNEKPKAKPKHKEAKRKNDELYPKQAPKKPPLTSRLSVVAHASPSENKTQETKSKNVGSNEVDDIAGEINDVIKTCPDAFSKASPSTDHSSNVNKITAPAQAAIIPVRSQVFTKVDTSKTSSLKVPNGCHADAFMSFIDLPTNDNNCSRVDMTNGLWFHCSLCNTEVKGRSDRPFTIGRWNEHIKPGSAHYQKLKKVDSIAEIRKKSKSGEVSTSMLSSF